MMSIRLVLELPKAIIGRVCAAIIRGSVGAPALAPRKKAHIELCNVSSAALQIWSPDICRLSPRLSLFPVLYVCAKK